MIEILNKEECGVTYVNQFFGKIFYNTSFWGRRHEDITKVIVLSSYVTKQYGMWSSKVVSVSAQLDLYTSDGKVIEVYTNDRKFLEACNKLTIKKDPRAYYRQQRGVL